MNWGGQIDEKEATQEAKSEQIQSLLRFVAYKCPQISYQTKNRLATIVIWLAESCAFLYRNLSF